MALYVKFKKPRTIKEFLIQFYSKDAYGGSYKIADNTYKDVECKQLHCDKAVRSFDDLFELIQTYYPSTTPQILIKHLLTVKIKKSAGGILKPYLDYCNGMRIIRYFPYMFQTSQSSLDQKMDNSKYTWSELLSLIGIKNLNEYKEFVNNN